jgi:peptidoglycan/LPS O-acetylase OafA/YrhL
VVKQFAVQHAETEGLLVPSPGDIGSGEMAQALADAQGPVSGGVSRAAYRRDIDGLRAIAVVSVVVYHLFAGVLPGGYLGVDIFFVISGFLITGILVRDCATGRYSIVRFYERRLRRIIPALVFLIAVVTAIATAILLSRDLVGYAKSVLATFAFVSNVYFWRDTNYFSPDASTKPLLHTWSLGIEEQFYIFFPIMVFLIMRFAGRRALLGAVIFLSAVSYALTVWVLKRDLGIVAFYLLPMRAWELGFGAIVSLAGSRGRAGPYCRAALGGLGLVLVLGSCFAISPTFLPGLPPATFACLGTALMIWAGERSNATSRLLEAGPMVAIGLISYSLYLWHWPLYVFVSYYLIRQPLPFEGLLILIAAVVISAASWRYVEQPFRQKTMRARTVVMAALAAVAFLGAVAAGLIVSRGLPQRFTAQAAAFNASAGQIYKCPVQSFRRVNGVLACPIAPAGAGTDNAGVALFGDSHALMYVPAVREVLRERRLSGLLFYSNGCLPTPDLNLSRECIASQRANLSAIEKSNVRVIVVALDWANLDQPMVDAHGRHYRQVPWPAVRGQLAAVLHGLRRAGKRTVIVGPIPFPGYDIASTVSREIAFRGRAESPLGEPRAAFDRRFATQQAWVTSGPEGAVAMLPARRFCTPENCSFELGGAPAYADSNHLSSPAVFTMMPDFAESIDAAWRLSCADRVCPSREERSAGAGR